ncbi:RusA family crossover junction endodeoxyribonuclease [Tissierella praeacuta]|uniref:RusA family crossover junction endodeoxyribonuclease n=1 Tax=Tissierella praeacuta TaxID=43131 RepID=UPI00333EBA4D
MRVFTVPGPPVAKGRPRLGKYTTYTPTKTVNYENLVQFSYIEQYKDADLLGGDLSVTINFYFPIPKSTSKKNRELMLKGEIRHNKRPDIDNCIKSITDALNNIAYKDDGQIVQIIASKVYSEEPRTEVCIEKI